MFELISIVFLIIGLGAVIVGTTGIFGYSLMQSITRQQAIYILLAGFFALTIAGRFNVQYLTTSQNNQNQNLPLNNVSSTTTTNSFSNKNNSANPQGSNQINSSSLDVNKILNKLSNLVINDDFSTIPAYDRDIYFGSWIDEDSDCQDTRAEVLINESLSSITYRDSSGCVVDSGEWFDPYSNTIFYQASDVDIDHFVPLYEAFYSGAYLWPEYKRIEYANDLFGNNDHLIAVDKSENRTKGKNPPQNWLPSNVTYHCEYVATWIDIKYSWELTITTAEFDFLERFIQSC